MRLLILLFLFTVPFISSGQSSSIPADYRRADSIALSLSGKRIKDPEQLVKQLTDSLPTDVEKARAIFRWITANIRYDSKELARIEKADFRIDKRFRSEAHARRWKGRNYYRKVYKALRKRKAVCEGYAMLFKHLCSWANIEAEVIGGHSRSYQDKIGKYKRPLHAWNAVKLNGKWHLLDATWASGSIHPITENFIFRFSDYYFLTPPEQFVMNHYPTDKHWLLMAEYPTVKEFYRSPIPHEGYFTQNILAVTPGEGVIRAEPDETVTLRLRLADGHSITQLSCIRAQKKSSDPLRYLSSQLVQVAEHEWELQICFPKKENFSFDVYLNGEPALRYLAVIRSAKKAKK